MDLTITDIPTEVIGNSLYSSPVHCSSCDIPVLRANSFAAYPLLNSITIQYSGVMDIEEGAFSDIATQLDYLDLSDNVLTVIKPSYFAGLTSVICCCCCLPRYPIEPYHTTTTRIVYRSLQPNNHYVAIQFNHTPSRFHILLHTAVTIRHITQQSLRHNRP